MGFESYVKAPDTAQFSITIIYTHTQAAWTCKNSPNRCDVSGYIAEILVCLGLPLLGTGSELL